MAANPNDNPAMLAPGACASLSNLTHHLTSLFSLPSGTMTTTLPIPPHPQVLVSSMDFCIDQGPCLGVSGELSRGGELMF